MLQSDRAPGRILDRSATGWAARFVRADLFVPCVVVVDGERVVAVSVVVSDIIAEERIHEEVGDVVALKAVVLCVAEDNAVRHNGDAAMDPDGSLYFTHHYIDGRGAAIETDIYVSYRR